jgi:hypothetical protein
VQQQEFGDMAALPLIVFDVNETLIFKRCSEAGTSEIPSPAVGQNAPGERVYRLPKQIAFAA